MLIQVLIADDNALIRSGLEDYLGAEPDMTVVASARDGSEAIELALRTRPDVVVMDLRMPVLDGLVATYQIVTRDPAIRVLMFTGVARRASVRAAFAAGASGYLLKDGDQHAVVAGVRRCVTGAVPLTPGLSI